MNRLYAVEAMLTTTGANADHRLAIRPSQIEPVAQALAAQLSGCKALDVAGLPDPVTAWLKPLARDLLDHKSRSMVIAGEQLPESIHVLPMR